MKIAKSSMREKLNGHRPYNNERYKGQNVFEENRHKLIDFFARYKIVEKFPRENNTDCCPEIEKGKVTMSDECFREKIKKTFEIETVKIGDQM